MPAFKTLDDLDVQGKRVLVRVDFNVPMADGEVTDATRIERGKVSLDELAQRGAKVIVLAHFGRPKGKAEPSMSLAPVARALQGAMPERIVRFAEDCVGPTAEQAVAALGDGEVVMLENLRFHAGEEKNDPDFSAALAALGDAYVNDAFSCSHRAHASVVGIAERLPTVAGRLMQAELDALTAALEDPRRPVAAVVGGAKVSTKLDVLGQLIAKMDAVVIGGGMANTFLHAQGKPVGKSLCEKDMADTARDILAKAEAGGCRVLLPVDAVLVKTFEAQAENRVAPPEDVADDEMIVDVGPATVKAVEEALATCHTLLWNGPMGAFELDPFDAGTNAVALAAADLTDAGELKSVAGGGDTVAALAKAGVLERFSYVSTAGGAFLEWLEGKPLPGVAALTA